MRRKSVVSPDDFGSETAGFQQVEERTATVMKLLLHDELTKSTQQAQC
jgi:hypothetical protein